MLTATHNSIEFEIVLDKPEVGVYLIRLREWSLRS